MRWPLHRKIGLGMILVGIAPLVCVTFMMHSHNWTPLESPVLLVPKEFRSPDFKTDLNGRYLVSLVFDKLPSVSREQCLMGFPPISNGGCESQGKTLDFDWRIVAEEGTIIESGSYEPRSFSGTEVAFAEFQGKRGRSQRVVLDLHRDAGELNTAHPRLVIQAAPEHWEGLPDLYIYSLRWAKTVGVLGFLWLLLPIAFRAIKHKSHS